MTKILSSVSFAGLVLMLGLGAAAEGKADQKCYTPVQKVETLYQKHDVRPELDDADIFLIHMKRKYPDENQRLVAYGNDMAKEAADFNQLQQAVAVAQKCYDKAYLKLSEEYRAEKLDEREMKVKMREIQKGAMASGDMLLDVAGRVGSYIYVYDLALKEEIKNLNLTLSGSEMNNGDYKTLTALWEYARNSVELPEKNTAEAAASISPAAGQGGNGKLHKGLQKAGLSSGNYLNLYEKMMKRIEAQENLEEQVSNMP